MKVLITGITGFVGSHLAEYLLSYGYEVYGIVRWRSRMENIETIRDRIVLLDSDIKDASSVKEAIKKIQPDQIYHLAGQSFVLSSFTIPAETFLTNVIGELNIFEAVREIKCDTLIMVAGSSEEYGLVYEKELPINETNPLRPLSPYAVSKVAQDLLGFQYFRSYGMKIIRTRAFNHTGPRRGEVFVTSNFAKQIAEIEKGKKEPVLWVGNLEAERDFTDVRDIVKGYHLALLKGELGEVYNLCSGYAWKISKILEYLLSLSKVKVEIKTDPSRLRPSDVMRLLGDCTKFQRKTGWKSEIPFEKTMEDLLNYWRAKV